MNECFTEGSPWRTAEEEEERWMNCYFRKLVSLYRKSPCLWKKDTRRYLDIERRHCAYGRIHEAMALPEVTVVEIVLRIREMRRLYVEELKRLLQAESSGHCYRPSFPWFYDLHRFLYPYLDYDEAVELHNVGGAIAEPKETDGLGPRRDPWNCGCVDCRTSSRNTVDGFLSPGQAFRALDSVGSPVVSLPEVRPHPRTCPGPRSRIVNASRQLDRLPSRDVCATVCDPSRCDERLKRHGIPSDDELTGARQVERCHEFTVRGLSCGSSSSDSCGTKSDHFEAFSTVVADRLRKLDKPLAARAQTEIQRILANIVVESKVIFKECSG
ncbi:uncharacterized protein LOC143374887 [Andrena cerasifolii]|uniref:uncharacterized protein LOC143374887 n=1 Tax=Andrena cerasifolii TaxID=2819439 RepID=UPI0040379A12